MPRSPSPLSGSSDDIRLMPHDEQMHYHVNSSLSAESYDPHLFRFNYNSKLNRVDDMNHGATLKTRQPTGYKKRLNEGKSHFLTRFLNSVQKVGSKKERVTVKKNQELTTMMKKNHPPEKAAKVLDVEQALRQ